MLDFLVCKNLMDQFIHVFKSLSLVNKLKIIYMLYYYLIIMMIGLVLISANMLISAFLYAN